ncbi:MAG: hypothetical protein B5M54_06285 [Candidatus Aminicenantes bacterium 4484_214]|nr:MAG: hypothetical protein B5M54_06285 [Candidatus Aminicenantes bacterium 4484_214]
MIIGLLEIELYFPSSHSLKEKRKILHRIKDKIQKKYNVALAELDYLDKWQRSRLGFVTLNNNKNLIVSIFNKIITEIDFLAEGEITFHQVNFW